MTDPDASSLPLADALRDLEKSGRDADVTDELHRTEHIAESLTSGANVASGSPKHEQTHSSDPGVEGLLGY